MSAVTVAPATRLAEFNALLTSVTQDVVQPDFSCTGSRQSLRFQHIPRPGENYQQGTDIYNSGSLGPQAALMLESVNAVYFRLLLAIIFILFY